MQAVESAVIAAAGLGSRLGLGMPKCMIEIGGKPILDHLLAILKPVVPDIRVVVGYREELIIDHCAAHHRSVVLARNPDYRNTNTAHSLSLGAQGITGKCLFIDGDMLISSSSLLAFLRTASAHHILVGLTEAKSENAVFADVQEAEGGKSLQGFSRSAPSRWEWANLVTGPGNLMDGAAGYVYQRLEEHLPLPGMAVELAEVDTPGDLEAAAAFARSLAPASGSAG